MPEGFVTEGLKKATSKFALLLRLAFLEGANRANTIFARKPPSRVWVFSERITFYPAGAVRKGSGDNRLRLDFVWDRNSRAGTQLKWFQPGLQKRAIRDPVTTAQNSARAL